MNMKRVKIVLACMALVALACGWYASRRATQLAAEHRAYREASAAYESLNHALDVRDLAEAVKQLDYLQRAYEAHKRDKEWARLKPYITEREGFLAYKQAEALYLQYVRVETTRSNEPLPDLKDILKQYEKFTAIYVGLVGDPAFSTPERAWHIEHDTGAGYVWQLVIRANMSNATYDDLKPSYDAALPYFKKAELSAAAAVDPSFDPKDLTAPKRYVSQSLTFMTRIEKLMDKEKSDESADDGKNADENKDTHGDGKKGRKGLGDFLSRLAAEKKSGQGNRGLGKMLSNGSKDLGDRFLPVPLKALGAGQGRLPGKGKK